MSNCWRRYRSMKGQLSYIAVLRSLSILVVVFFHTYGYMYAASHFPDSVEQYHHAYYWINQCVFINLAMPLFTVISGFLFAYQYAAGKYHDFWKMAGKKFQRLIIPFIIFALAMMATTGVPFKPWMLYTGGLSHLWYLPMLFWCFIIGYWIQKYIRQWYWLAAILLMLLLLVLAKINDHVPHIFQIHNIIPWYPWFLLGQIIAIYYAPTLAFFSKKPYLMFLLLIPFCVQSYLWPVEYGEATWYSKCTIIAFIFGLWHLAGKTEKWNAFFKPFLWFSKYSFGIYIFHNWIGPYLISSTSKKLLPLQELATNHIILFPFVLTIVILLVSLLLSWCLLKTRIGKLLIG